MTKYLGSASNVYGLGGVEVSLKETEDPRQPIVVVGYITPGGWREYTSIPYTALFAVMDILMHDHGPTEKPPAMEEN